MGNTLAIVVPAARAERLMPDVHQNPGACYRQGAPAGENQIPRAAWSIARRSSA